MMAGLYGGVQALVHQQCPQAIFVHYYAYQLNFVLLHMADNIKELKLFISSLMVFHNFFRRSVPRSDLLQE